MARPTPLKGHKKLEKRIVDISKAVERVLDLEYHDIRVAFNRQPGDDGATACETVAKWEYSQAIMTWNIDAVVAMRRKHLVELVVHEYVHVLLGPIHEFLPEKHIAREEFVTENIARVLVRQIKDKV